MADMVVVQVRFRKALWICPQCGQEDVEDFNVEGGNKYEHNCSNCNTWFNTFKDYHGVLSMSSSEYASKQQKDIDGEKKKKFDDWVLSIKNPPAVVEPTKEELEVEKSRLMLRVNSIQSQIDAKTIGE